MNQYQKELQTLKPNDEVQGVETLSNGYQFITTAGHGYLVVLNSDKNYQKAKSICQYGYIGNLAIYLEEDCEAPEFLNSLKEE